ncbi:MAG: hypothetical protein QNK05_06090 [Myxococcota bacterium]|nr:hypothetical protein [Myxococcota bacterium]
MLAAHQQPLVPPGGEWLAQAVCLWRPHADSRNRTLKSSLAPGEARLPDFLEQLARLSLASPDREDPARIREGLRTATGLPASALDRIESEMRAVASNLELKHVIAEHLAERLGDATPAAALSLLVELLGPAPLRVGDAMAIVTPSACYLGVRYESGELLEPDFATRPEDEQAAVRAWVRRVEAANSPMTDRFPAFGYFDRDAVSATLLAELEASVTRALGRVPRSVLLETLATMVQLTPTHQLGMYLVHDAWGHGWQETLCDFEWLYARTPHLEDPLEPGTGPFFAGEGSPTLGSAFVAEGERTVLRADRLHECIAADLRGRLATGANGALAELLADIADYELARMGFEAASSSLLPRHCVRLDLILEDLCRYAEMATAPVRALALDPRRRAELAEALAADGLPERGLAAAVDEAAAQLRDRWLPLVSPRLEDGVVVQRLACAMAALAVELDRGHPPVSGEPEDRPEPWVDLLTIALAWVYEQDRARHFWQLDVWLRDVVAPGVSRFAEALPTADARSPGDMA